MKIMMFTMPNLEDGYEKLSNGFSRSYLNNSKKRFGFTTIRESSVTYISERDWNTRSAVSFCKEQEP